MANRTGSADLPLHSGYSESRALERVASGPTFDGFVRDERAKSAEYDGRTV